jgi:hypothetical protein
MTILLELDCDLQFSVPKGLSGGSKVPTGHEFFSHRLF